MIVNRWFKGRVLFQVMASKGKERYVGSSVTAFDIEILLSMNA